MKKITTIPIANLYFVRRNKSKKSFFGFALNSLVFTAYFSFFSICLFAQDSTKSKSLDEVVVKATRANEKSGMAFTNIYKKELSKQNLGQDLPFLLNFLPSVTITSDAGAGVGYTGIRIRGTDATRINVTINGMPYNDAESQGSYFVDLPDISSSIQSIQVQRGVGTSTNGAGAFGGSLNINTLAYEEKPYVETNISYGSFNTLKINLLASTGLLKSGFVLDARVSKISSDGFIDRASSNLKSFYVSGGYYHKNNFIRLNVFSGHETTYQAWNGIPESRLNNDIQGMKDYINRNGLTENEAQNLLNSGSRTYNMFTYKNQVDDYLQSHFQLIGSYQVGKFWRFNQMFHFTKGKGYYEEYKNDQSFSDYGLKNVNDTLTNSNLIRRKWLDNNFYGITYSFDYQGLNNFSTTIGGALNKYDGKHYGEIIWAQYLPNNTIGTHYYDNIAHKTDFNLFVKAIYQIMKPLNTYVDFQIRMISYDFVGTESHLQNISQKADYQFFTPKFGINYSFENSNLYASYGIGKKEPSRQDFVDNFPKTPKPETLQDLEIGYRYAKDNLALAANYYYMNYKDQLVLTGKLNDVGEAIRQNVPQSYRSGIELEAGYRFTNKIKVGVNTTLSQNKVKNFMEVLPNYDGDADKVNTYSKTDISFSPNCIIAGQLTYSPTKNLEIVWLSKYVSKQYLDNTSNETRKLKSYFTNDLRLNFNVPQKIVKSLIISLLVNNLFNIKYESNGYTYSYIYDKQVVTENFYYPQAGTNFLMAMRVRI